MRENAAARAGRIHGYLKADLNGDGAITLSEAHAFAKQFPALGPFAYGKAIPGQYLELNRDGDALTRPQVEARAGTVFDHADINGDGKINADEGRKLAEPDLADCGLPRPDSKARIIYAASTFRAPASSISIAGQSLRTGVQDVVIQEGTTPIYLVLSVAPPTIWRLRGATDRVVHVVAPNEKPQPRKSPKLGLAANAVIGVARNRVSFVRPECVSVGSSGLEARAIGRTIDEFRSNERPRSSDIELIVSKRDEGPSEPMAIDPADVISANFVESYGITPGKPGIEQLLREGSIELVPTADPAPGRRPQYVRYRLLKPVAQFPVDLGAFELLVPVGLDPPPTKIPARVLSEETGSELQFTDGRYIDPVVDPYYALKTISFH